MVCFLNRISRVMLSLTIFMTASLALADGPAFTNLSSADFDNVSKEFSANFVHSSVLGAASMGSIFGFELALVAGTTATPEIDKIVQRSSPGDSLDKLYHGGFLVALSVPFGITGELVTIPKTSSQDASFQLMSLGVKLTLNEQLLAVIPFNLALRGIYTNSSFDFKQSSGGVDGTVENKNTVTGLQILASPKLPLVEPYAGIGFLKAKNSLSVTGTGTVFDTTVTSGQSADSEPSTTQLILGVNVKLLVSLGLEYSKAFDTSRYTAKLGFGF